MRQTLIQWESIVLRKPVIWIIGVLALASSSALCHDAPSREEAVAMVKRVQEKFQKDGPDATFRAVTDKAVQEFHDRNLYPFIYDLSGIIVASGGHTALIGKNLLALKDSDGKYFVHEMFEVANGAGSGWVNYKFPNPFTGTVQPKSAYIERMGDYIVGVGIWGERPSLDGASSSRGSEH
jgi:cytochrome c